MDRTPLPPKPSRPISGHSAFRSVWFPIGWLRHSTQGVLEESHRPRRLASRSPVSRRPTVCPNAPPWNGLRCTGSLALRHFTGPFEMSDSRELTPHSYPPWLHDHYSLHRYYGLVRLPQVLPCGSPKSLTELSERATPLDPAVCLPPLYRSLFLEDCWFQTFRSPDHTNF